MSRKITRPLCPNERMYYNLLKICSKYGEVNANYDLCKKSILAYVKTHPDDVMAVITRDAEYFTYDVNFEFWSVFEIELNTLRIMKIFRELLNEAHGLTYEQMQLMFAIFDVKPFDPRFRLFTDKIK